MKCSSCGYRPEYVTWRAYAEPVATRTVSYAEPYDAATMTKYYLCGHCGALTLPDGKPFTKERTQ